MLRIAACVLFLALSSGAVACGDSGSGSPRVAQSDRVVNIVWRCEPSARYASMGEFYYNRVARDIEQAGCRGVERDRLGASTLEVTVRTPQGGSYVVNADPYTEPGASLAVGDPWPK